MKQLINKKFFKTNTEAGVERYLSKIGFDISEPYEFIPAHNKYHVYCVSGEDIPKEPEPEPEPDLSGPLPLAVAQILIMAGYTTVSDVFHASDEDLLKIKGISKGRLQQIRDLIAPEEMASREA
jgi:hypothetical protein